MDHTSLHSYLEHRLSKESIVTDTMVVEAKKEYRKYYQQKYQKQYKGKNVQITFRVSPKQYRKIQKEATERNLKTTVYAKRKVLGKGDGSRDTKSLQVLTLKTIDLLEEAQMEQTPVPIAKVLDLLAQILKQLK